MVPPILWIAGGVLALAGLGLYLYQRWRPTPAPEYKPVAELEAFRLERERSFEPAREIEILADEVRVLESDMPDAATNAFRRVIGDQESFVWNELKIHEQNKMEMAFHIDGKGAILTPEFEVWRWFPGILDTDIFKPGAGTAVTYQGTDGHYGMWLHSGKNQTMSALQFELERDENGRIVPYLNAHYETTRLIGSEVYFRSDKSLWFSEIVAAVRIPPSEVYRLSAHLMDLPDYLAENYGYAGFGTLAEYKPEDILILYFCGLALGGEDPNPAMDKWTQARFILALAPYQKQFDTKGLIE